MSANIVGNAHLNAMVNLALFGPRGREVHPGNTWRALSWYAAPPTPDLPLEGWAALSRQVSREGAVDLGQLLADTNADSVAWRYREAAAPVPFFWLAAAPRPTALEGLMVLACYEYQACEHPGWWTSEAQRFCEALRRRLASALPGFDGAAGWEWRDESHREGG
jgi:hypothetical protein